LTQNCCWFQPGLLGMHTFLAYECHHEILLLIKGPLLFIQCREGLRRSLAPWQHHVKIVWTNECWPWERLDTPQWRLVAGDSFSIRLESLSPSAPARRPHAYAQRSDWHARVTTTNINGRSTQLRFTMPHPTAGGQSCFSLIFDQSITMLTRVPLDSSFNKRVVIPEPAFTYLALIISSLTIGYWVGLGRSLGYTRGNSNPSRRNDSDSDDDLKRNEKRGGGSSESDLDSHDEADLKSIQPNWSEESKLVGQLPVLFLVGW
jgi:hypothetical protein